MMGKIPNAANRGMRYFRDSLAAAAAAAAATIVITEVGVDDAECRDLTLGQAAESAATSWTTGWVGHCVGKRTRSMNQSAVGGDNVPRSADGWTLGVKEDKTFRKW